MNKQLVIESYQHMFEMASLSVFAELMLNPRLWCVLFSSRAEEPSAAAQTASCWQGQAPLQEEECQPCQKGPQPSQESPPRHQPGQVQPLQSAPTNIPAQGRPQWTEGDLCIFYLFFKIKSEFQLPFNENKLNVAMALGNKK